ncbi:hypothetical protein PMAYCL1PPCAC_11442, partial [Pristionchus mayeri]
DSPAIIYYTSGTTGGHKGVLHTHHTLLVAVEIYAKFILDKVHPAVDVAPEDALTKHQIVNTPLFHLMGFLMLNMCLLKGMPAVINLSPDPAKMLRMIKEYEPIFLLTYPLMVKNLLKNADADIRSLKVIVSSGSRLRREIADSFLRRFKSVKFLAQGFGMTEVGPSHLPLLNERCSVESVGAVVEEYEQKVLEIDRARACLPGELGELCIRGPSMMVGYLNMEKETNVAIYEEGWLHTGDAGYLNELGEFHLIDRVKDTIIIECRGTIHRVSRNIIENINRMNEQENALLANKCLRAFILKGAKQIDEATILDLVSENLPECMHLTGGIRFVEEIPRTRVGKLLRRKLPID